MIKPSELEVAQKDCSAAYTALELAEAEVDRANEACNRAIARLNKEEETKV